MLIRTGSYAKSLRRMFGHSLVSYLPLQEAAGATAFDFSRNGRNGANTGTTLGVPGPGWGSAYSLDGTTSFVNWYSASLASGFNASEGTLMAWAKVGAAGVWTDATTRRIVSFRADASNVIHIYRPTTNNIIQYQIVFGGTSLAINSPSLTGNIGWIHTAITWSKSQDKFIAYANGVQTGATATGLGTWAGALGSTQCAIGSQITTPVNVWSGSIAHVALLNRAATADEIARAYRMAL